jgi:hypothetical protein
MPVWEAVTLIRTYREIAWKKLILVFKIEM